jgi:hypothetical protein
VRIAASSAQWARLFGLLGAVATCSPLSGLTDGAKDAATDITTNDSGDDDASSDGSPPSKDGADDTLGDAASYRSMDGGMETSPDASTSLLGCSAPGLVAYWPLDETGGTSIFDCSGNHLDGVLVGSVGHGPGHSGLAVAVTPAADGGNGFNLASPTKLNITGAMTISAWINATSGGAILTKDTNAQFGWSLAVTGGPNVRFTIAPTAGTTMTAQSTLSLGTWVHVAGVFEPSTSVRLYVNGVLRDAVTTGVPAAMYTASYNNASLGMRGGTTTCCSPTALIDEVRIYGRVLDVTEIATLAQ